MTTLQAPATTLHRRQGSWKSWLALAFGRARPRAVLDPRTLPDHLKRDIGFLDGNDPSGKRR
ncbi:hypothetical protein [Kumtagia ephedrae]|jgi:hypothetical protein|uniref:DUF1127 domain-containing protein n=1 Tax=Kumtagia ephedrae TaxID=2116701 RepID=A0A2P7S1F3_9HYPH|nr:hypothetical protein [Mesorhizobium ephedrae]PSJ56305.1 hypothetical protein C7I84_20750 [Mesorhizobium ephedrae]